MTPDVGIDDLNVDGGTLSLATAALAAARGFADRDVQAAGFARRSVLPPYEDAVTLAVNAARPVVASAGRDAFGLLIVATESGLDYGKPLSTYVHAHLGLPARCRNFEVKHACYAGTAAVRMAVSWVQSTEARGMKALVVMSDVARRHTTDPAELTAGTGAVALSIAADPAVMVIEPHGGCACREVYDVARPHATGEYGDAVLSLAAYLDLIEEAWSDYTRDTDDAAPLATRFRYMLYHTPLVSLVRDAHRLLLEATGDTGDDVACSFQRMVAPALGYARELANTYSASVYCLLAGLIDGDAPLEPGTRIGICSYGSGSCAEIYGGVIANGACATVGRHRIAQHLAARTDIDVALYERLVAEMEVVQTACDYVPDRNILPGHLERMYDASDRLVLLGIENHHRRYGRASS